MSRWKDAPMVRLMVYIRSHRRRAWVAVTASVINKVLDLMPPLLVAWVIDSVRGEAPGWIRWMANTDDPFRLAAFLAALAFVIFFFESVFQWMYQYAFMTLAQRTQHQLRLDAYQRIQQREIAFFENNRLGETLAVLNDDVNQLERFLNTGFNKLLQLGVLLVFSVTVLFQTSWQLALVGLIPFPIIIWGSLLYQRLVSPRYARVRDLVGKLSSRLENNIAGIMVIKSFTAEAFEAERVREASAQYVAANDAAIRLNSVYVPLIRMCVALGFSGVLLLGSYWILRGEGVLTVGELVLFSMLIQRVLWPLTEMGITLDDYERAKASARRLFGLMDAPSTITDPENPIHLGRTRGQITFSHVYFHYGNELPVLTDFNLHVKAGETVGIAGTTGAGKSTLIKLLLRLYDPVAGEITIDGVPLNQITLYELRQHIALVSQDVYLFHGSIYDNLAYSLTDTTMDRVIDAAVKAEFHDFVTSLPDGYHTIVGERGIKLSGGQRQRLSIARAILKDAPIMIFDEATSSVDTETERAIQHNINRLTAGKTALIIAHRLSTIRHADRIVVVGNGKVLEEGHHDDLVAQGGVYADLWNIQIGEG